MTNEEMHENLILLEYEKYSEKEYKPMTYAKFVTQKLIEARQELSKLHQPTVIKNEVTVCPECGCNKVQKLVGGNYSCMNAYCEWQTVL